MTGEESNPSEEQRAIFDFVRSAVCNRLDQFGTWPANLFKLELEQHGIYQNFSGRILAELQQRKIVDRGMFDDYPYIVPFGKDEPPDSEVREHTEDFYAFIRSESTSSFAELCVYATLCDRLDTLGDNSDFEVFPKGEYPYKIREHDDEVDALFSIPYEYFPVEVYNGTGLVDQELHNKASQIEKNSTRSPSDVNPILVSRLAASNFRSFTRRQNGVVADTGVIIGCQESVPDLGSSIEFLNLDSLVELVPPIQSDDGRKITGSVYDDLVTSEPRAVHPQNMSSAAQPLPDVFCDVLAGLLNLVFVNSFYRRAETPTQREAALVLQNCFHPLMRQGGGFDTDELVEIGWTRLEDKYRQIEKARPRESQIRSTTKDYITDLLDVGIIQRRSNGLYARSCTHPHASLQFPEGFNRES